MAPVRAGLNRRPPVAGAILAGGGSRRFGSDKALAETPDGPMAAAALKALREAGVDPVVLIGGSPELSAALAVPSVPDRYPDEGPLGGLATALGWATGVARIVVVPCDMPLVTAAAIRSLTGAGDNSEASIAQVLDRTHPIMGCWPTSRGAAMNALMRSGSRKMSDALDTGPYVLCEIDATAAADADTPDELDRLLSDQ